MSKPPPTISHYVIPSYPRCCTPRLCLHFYRHFTFFQEVTSNRRDKSCMHVLKVLHSFCLVTSLSNNRHEPLQVKTGITDVMKRSGSALVVFYSFISQIPPLYLQEVLKIGQNQASLSSYLSNSTEITAVLTASQ